LSAAAAALMVTVGASVAYQLGHLRFTGASQNRYVDAMIRKVSSGMRPGLSDHIHCAVFRKYGKHAPPLEAVREDLAPEYRPLIDIVRAGVPAAYSVYMAHQCSFRGRKFVHIALKSESVLLSVVLTRREPGETLAENQVAPVLTRDELNLYGAGAQRFRMSAFETPNSFAYLISNGAPGEAHRIMLAMSSGIRALLAKLPA
jgi:hypothetical protein